MQQRSKMTLSPRGTAFWLVAITLFLLVAHLISIAMPYIFDGFNHLIVRLLFSLFFLDGEGNLPALFSTWLFLMNATLFAMVWKAKREAAEPQRIWLFLSAVFVFLAIDESISIHERLIETARRGCAKHVYNLLIFLRSMALCIP
jgi:hypothetical protein